MYRLERTKTYIKEFMKVRFTNDQYVRFIMFIGKLLENKPLPTEAQDHSLKGEWRDYREFHISGDLLVIYKVEGDLLKLVRIGTHSELF